MSRRLDAAVAPLQADGVLARPFGVDMRLGEIERLTATVGGRSRHALP